MRPLLGIGTIGILLILPSCGTGAPNSGKYPDLGVVRDTIPLGQNHSFRRLIVRNGGAVEGKGRVEVEVLDSLGRVMLRRAVGDGRAFAIPTARNGGAEGIALSLLSVPGLTVMTDSLSRAGARFALRATVTTVGKDGDVLDNTTTRQWGSWHQLNPSGTARLDFSFELPASASGDIGALAYLDIPPSLLLAPDGVRSDTVWAWSASRYGRCCSLGCIRGGRCLPCPLTARRSAHRCPTC